MKWKFVRGALNIVDLLAILPYFLNFVLEGFKVGRTQFPPVWSPCCFLLPGHSRHRKSRETAAISSSYANTESVQGQLKNWSTQELGREIVFDGSSLKGIAKLFNMQVAT